MSHRLVVVPLDVASTARIDAAAAVVSAHTDGLDGLDVPTAAYVRFATHYGFRPDFCEAKDPESKGAVEALVRYAKSDLVVPADDFGGDLAVANAAAAAWCDEVNGGLRNRGWVDRQMSLTSRR